MNYQMKSTVQTQTRKLAKARDTPSKHSNNKRNRKRNRNRTTKNFSATSRKRRNEQSLWHVGPSFIEITAPVERVNLFLRKHTTARKRKALRAIFTANTSPKAKLILLMIFLIFKMTKIWLITSTTVRGSTEKNEYRIQSKFFNDSTSAVDGQTLLLRRMWSAFREWPERTGI